MSCKKETSKQLENDPFGIEKESDTIDSDSINALSR